MILGKVANAARTAVKGAAILCHQSVVLVTTLLLVPSLPMGRPTAVRARYAGEVGVVLAKKRLQHAARVRSAVREAATLSSPSVASMMELLLVRFLAINNLPTAAPERYASQVLTTVKSALRAKVSQPRALTIRSAVR